MVLIDIFSKNVYILSLAGAATDGPGLRDDTTSAPGETFSTFQIFMFLVVAVVITIFLMVIIFLVCWCCACCRMPRRKKKDRSKCDCCGKLNTGTEITLPINLMIYLLCAAAQSHVFTLAHHCYSHQLRVWLTFLSSF